MLHKNEKPKTSGNCLCFRSLFIFNCQKQSLRTLDLAGAQASGANVHMTRSSLHNRFYTLYVRLPCSVRPSVGVRNLDTEGNTLSANSTFSHSTAPADCRKIDFCGSLQTNISILSNFPKKSNPFPRILLNIFFTIKIPFEKYNYLRKQTVKSNADLFSKSNRKRNRHISGILSCGNLVNFMSNGKIGLNFSGKPCIIKRTHYRVSG